MLHTGWWVFSGCREAAGGGGGAVIAIVVIVIIGGLGVGVFMMRKKPAPLAQQAHPPNTKRKMENIIGFEKWKNKTHCALKAHRKA